MIIIPQHLLLDAVLDANFIAKFALFLGALLCGTIVISKVLHYFLSLPVIAGQIIGGIILGPSLLKIDQWAFFGTALELTDPMTQEIFVFRPTDLYITTILMLSAAVTVSYLLWMAGHETDLVVMKKVGFVAITAGILGALVPIILNGGLAYILDPERCGIAAAIGIGLVFAATSVSIPVAMLIAQKKMHLRSSQATMGAAVVDDILAVGLVSFFLVALQSGLLGSPCSVAMHKSSSIWSSLARMLVSMVVLSLVGYYVLPILTRVLRRFSYDYLIPVAAFGVMLFFFSAAEIFGGLAGITGAYFAGLFHRRSDEEHAASAALTPFIEQVLLPLFLASIGLQLDLHLLQFSDLKLVIAITVVAMAAKFIGVFLATGLTNLLIKSESRWSMRESYLFGAAMVARGEVGLVIATLLRGASLITNELYVICVVAIVLTTVITPVLLSFGFKRSQS